MDSKSQTYQTATDVLAARLAALQRQECYVVDEVLKESPTEVTQRVHFEGANGACQGPFIRKRIKRVSGLGSAYERIFAAQQAGKRFQFIPRIYDFAAFGDEIVVVMELVSGETLDEVIYRCDPSMALAVDVFPRLCDAVAELHEQFDPPIVHRDLKPGNIMLSSNSLTIIDFGISRTCKDGAQTDTTHFGTRAYAPPEQFGFAQTTVRSDVYALGLLLYYCLVERVPDQAARERGFADANIPEPIRLVIEKAAQFDPKQRYVSARELKAAFEGAVREIGFVLVRPDGTFEMGLGAGAQSERRASHGPTARGTGAVRRAALRKASRGKAAQPVSRKGPENVSARADLAGGVQGIRDLVSAFISGTKALIHSDPIPQGLGIAWNAVVFAVYAFFAAIIIYGPFNPQTQIDPQLPFWYVVMEFWFMMLVMFTSFAYALLDRRRLQKRFPFLSRLNWWQTFLAAAIASAVAIFITFLVGIPYIQPSAASMG